MVHSGPQRSTGKMPAEKKHVFCLVPLVRRGPQRSTTIDRGPQERNSPETFSRLPLSTDVHRGPQKDCTNRLSFSQRVNSFSYKTGYFSGRFGVAQAGRLRRVTLGSLAFTS